MSFEELKSIGFKSFGKDIRISRKVSVYNPQFISIGDEVRIDDFCILSASKKGIIIGNHVHITAYVVLAGGENITIENFVAIGAHSCIYSSNDDYSGETMTNSTIESEYKNVHTSPVLIGKHTIIGSHSTILPGVTIGEVVSIGSHSLVKTDLNPYGIYCGVPVVFLKERKGNLLQLEKKLTERTSGE